MNFVAWLIVVCEVAFWIVIIAGLSVRYGLKRPKLGLALLALTPVIDLLLFVITGVDLYNGAAATTAHGIAAVYIGVSIAFGKSMIDWADRWYRYLIAGEKEARPPKRYGLEFAKQELRGFLRHALSFLIGGALLLGMITFIDDLGRTEALGGILRVWGLVLGIDGLVMISAFVWPKQPKQKPDRA
ncbi:MAG: hypothetical protein E7E23_13415 [Paenibacillus sp.]|uniref:hypothetical protein n=1 Tax=Paenibacillus sp. TaxID=58172 RepID=UPI002901A9B3|nr:hypothetical protein [Paenibacillus sp.]MDU2241574.1 hypothetical protein [Paenibacillus sp.]